MEGRSRDVYGGSAGLQGVRGRAAGAAGVWKQGGWWPSLLPPPRGPSARPASAPREQPVPKVCGTTGTAGPQGLRVPRPPAAAPSPLGGRRPRCARGPGARRSEPPPPAWPSRAPRGRGRAQPRSGRGPEQGPRVGTPRGDASPEGGRARVTRPAHGPLDETGRGRTPQPPRPRTGLVGGPPLRGRRLPPCPAAPRRTLRLPPLLPPACTPPASTPLRVRRSGGAPRRRGPAPCTAAKAPPCPAGRGVAHRTGPPGQGGGGGQPSGGGPGRAQCSSLTAGRGLLNTGRN